MGHNITVGLVILVNKANIKASADYAVDDISNNSHNDNNNLIVMTMRININEYLLPYSGSVLNTFCVLLYQVFLATLRRYVCHPYFTDGKLMLSN